MVSWLNFYSDRPEGDERCYARAVARRHGLDLREIRKRFRPLSEEDFAFLCRNARPPVGAADPVRDEETVRQLSEAGASAVLSGQGAMRCSSSRPRRSSWRTASSWRAGVAWGLRP